MLFRSAHNLKSCDVVYVYCSPITAAIAPLLCNLLWKIPLVAHVQDLWPESVTQSGMVPSARRGIANRLAFSICDGIYSRFSALVTIAPGMEKMVTARGIPSERITSIYNWSPVAAPQTYETKSSAAARVPRTALYAGNLGAAQDLNTVADAVQACGPDLPLRVRMVGSGLLSEVLKDRAREIPQLSVEDPVDVSEIDRKSVV